MRNRLLILTFVVMTSVGVSGCNEDQDACNEAAGNGKYNPVTEDGVVYCENPFNGDRFYLRSE